jgi:hypothetical protein
LLIELDFALSAKMSGQLGGPSISLKFDPFLTKAAYAPTGTGNLTSQASGSQISETRPLVSDPGTPVGRKGGEAKLMVLPTACCMLTQTFVSVLALAVSFNETGHRDGYNEGHLDPENEAAGCEAIFYWLMVQAFLDFSITCMACMFLVSTLKSEPVGVHGGCATIRMCTLAAGLHILYFSGLKKNLCDKFLVVWSTIIIWLGIGIMLLIAVILTFLLLGAVGTSQPRPAPRKNVGATLKPYDTIAGAPRRV